MEVHKHPHQVTHTKNWKEYLLEFFMLFLAVFLGFLAENIRESIVEREKEKQYIASEVHNLRLDTAQFNNLIITHQHRILQLDTLITLLHLPDKNANLNDIYFLARSSTLNPGFNYNDGAIQQLKNSGGFRILRNKSVADSIMLYDGSINFIKQQDNLVGTTATEFRSHSAEIFDPYVFYQIMKGTSAERPVNAPAFLTDEKKLFDAAIARFVYLRSVIYVTTDSYRSAKTRAANLIRFLQNEYHQ